MRVDLEDLASCFAGDAHPCSTLTIPVSNCFSNHWRQICAPVVTYLAHGGRVTRLRPLSRQHWTEAALADHM